MKIRKVYLNEVSQTKNYVNSFDDTKFRLEYIEGVGVLIDDSTLVPLSNIKEMVVEKAKPAVKPKA